MPLVSTSIPNLLNGVSQQPSSLRQVTQGETQTNALSSVIDGLIKRPPTEHVGKVSTLPVTDAAVHVIDRGEGQRHVLVVETNGQSLGATTPTVTLNMFDVDGNSMEIRDSNGTVLSSGTGTVPYSGSMASYFTVMSGSYVAGKASTDIQFLTVADSTFILNNKKTVTMKSDTVSGSLITSSKYQGFDDLPVETSTHHVGDGSTNRFPVGFNFHDTNDLTVTVNGTSQPLNVAGLVGGYFLEDDNKTVRLQVTPANFASIVISLDPPVGDIIEVIGDAGNAFDSFYVKSVSKSAYEETVKPGIKYKLDNTTLPLVLTPVYTGSSGYETVSHFVLDYVTWDERTVGDLDSAPDPSFVGKTISNMFFYKNRLGFLSEENIVFSAAGDFFRFFPKTVTTILDDGPIDVAASHTKVSLLKHAIPFNESLTLFSESTQFTIENVGNLTPKTISVVPSTHFENDDSVAPVGAGNYLYFASKKGEYSSIREYYIESDTIMSDALEITAHVPKYVPKNLVKLATSSNEDILFGLSSVDRSKIYVYKWFTDGTQKLQSSWSTWEMPTGSSILDLDIIENIMYLVISRSDGVYLEKIDLQYLDDAGLDFCARMDRKTSVTGIYHSGTGYTTWQLPYLISTDIPLIAVKSGSWPERKGANISTTRPHAGEITAVGDYSSAPVLVGVPYTMTYEFSTQHVRENNGSQSVQSGRLQLRTMRVNFENSGYFKIEVTPFARPTYEYEYTGVVLNQLGSTIGDVSLNDGTYRFPVQSKNDRVSIKLVSDSFLPCAFQNAEWEGFYNIRSKRI